MISLHEIEPYVSRTSYSTPISAIELPTDWTGSRPLPVKITFPECTRVLHRRAAPNLAAFKELIAAKNSDKRISSIVTDIGRDFFMTDYIAGTHCAAALEDIARLHAEFNAYDKEPNISFWNKLLSDATSHLEQAGLIPASPQYSFSSFGLLHGDVGANNIIKGQDLVLIDIEHAMYGPVAFDLARPLLRLCKTEHDRHRYLTAYGRIPDDLHEGFSAFFIIQAYRRDILGYRDAALHSIDHLQKAIWSKQNTMY